MKKMLITIYDTNEEMIKRINEIKKKETGIKWDKSKLIRNLIYMEYVRNFGESGEIENKIDQEDKNKNQ